MRKFLILAAIFFFVRCAVAQQLSAIDTLYTFKSFDGTTVAFQVRGSGYPVFLIHGFIVNSESWKKAALYRELPASGFSAITIDLRGNGRSDKPHRPEAYENDAEAKDVIALADLLGIQKYGIVGYSRGAIITSRLLMLDPRVSMAVMGGMGADFTNPQWPRRIMFYEALSGKPVKELEGLIKRIQDTGLDQQALAYMQRSQPSTSKEEFSKVKKPVLVICGTEDEDNGSAKELSSLIPGSDYVRVPGNHGGTSGTKEFANEVITFLKKNVH